MHLTCLGEEGEAGVRRRVGLGPRGWGLEWGVIVEGQEGQVGGVVEGHRC